MRKVRRNSTKQLEKRFLKATGCDVDKDIVVIANYAVDSEEIFTKEFEQTHNQALKAVEYIKEFGSEFVVMESTANYHLLFHDVFTQNGLNVGIINPLSVSALLKVEGKNDKADAITLARLATSFSLKLSNMPDTMQRQIRLYLRNLDKLKRRRTQVVNYTQSLLTSYGCNLFRTTKLNTVSGLGMVRGICERQSKVKIFETYWKGSKTAFEKINESFGKIELIPDYVFIFLHECIDEIERLNCLILNRSQHCEELIEELNLSEIVALICTCPVMNPLLSLRIIGEMGVDFTLRYSSNEKFVKAIGICPQNIVSGGKVLKKQSSHGNVHLKQHLLNSVKSYCVTTRKKSKFKSFYDDYKKRSSFKKAVSATARRIMTVVYAMVKNNKPFEANLM
jgi:transposase